MSNKIWSKNNDSVSDPFITSFTVGNDNQLDQDVFMGYDIIATRAHAEALRKAGIYSRTELKQVKLELDNIHTDWTHGRIEVTIDDEDGHTVLERLLTERLGDIGKKIHTGRSRNDQSLVAMRLFMVDTLDNHMDSILGGLLSTLYDLQSRYRYTLFIGYSHTQQAMPITLGHYFNGFFEQLQDDKGFARLTCKHINTNPLGSGAGFGSIVPINRKLTTRLLNFDSIQKNSLYCKNSKGKIELKYVHALSQIMMTLQKISTDMILYTSKEFNFFTASDSVSTGSSIMPQKRNLDVAEIVRGHSALLSGIETQIRTLYHGLMSGYHRDTQLIKKCIYEAFELTYKSVKAVNKLLTNLTVNEDQILLKIDKTILAADIATYNAVNGQPFRDAYKTAMDEVMNMDSEEDYLAIALKRKTIGSPGNY